MHGQDAPSRQSEVSEQMQDIDNTIANLLEVSDGLRERLAAVLRQPELAKDEGKTASEEASLCTHAEQLRSYNRRLQQVKQNLTSLKGQLEI